MLQQAGKSLPDDTPFKDTLPFAQNDPTLDPFDAIEMIGVPGSMATSQPAAGTQPPTQVPTTPGTRTGALSPVASCQFPVASCQLKTDYVLLATDN